jgi:hypothetical protein
VKRGANTAAHAAKRIDGELGVTKRASHLLKRVRQAVQDASRDDDAQKP